MGTRNLLLESDYITAGLLSIIVTQTYGEQMVSADEAAGLFLGLTSWVCKGDGSKGRHALCGTVHGCCTIYSVHDAEKRLTRKTHSSGGPLPGHARRGLPSWVTVRKTLSSRQAIKPAERRG